MGYCTLDDVKNYKQLTTSDLDSLIEDLIDDVTVEIDTHVGRTFTAFADVRYYDPNRDVDGQTLFVDEDLLSVTSILNGDGNYLPLTDFVLEPYNFNPKYGITIKTDSSTVWTYNNSPEASIAVNGSWGYSFTVPRDVVRATIRTVVWRLDQRDAPFETTGLSGQDSTFIPSALPVDIERMLEKYKKRIIK